MRRTKFPKVTKEQIDKDSRSMRETADCVVRSFAMAFQVPLLRSFDWST